MRGRIGDQVVQYPATIGHECAGTVIEVGSAPQRLLAPGGSPVLVGIPPTPRVSFDSHHCGR